MRSGERKGCQVISDDKDKDKDKHNYYFPLFILFTLWIRWIRETDEEWGGEDMNTWNEQKIDKDNYKDKDKDKDQKRGEGKGGNLNKICYKSAQIRASGGAFIPWNSFSLIHIIHIVNKMNKGNWWGVGRGRVVRSLVMTKTKTKTKTKKKTKTKTNTKHQVALSELRRKLSYFIAGALHWSTQLQMVTKLLASSPIFGKMCQNCKNCLFIQLKLSFAKENQHK